MTDKVTHETTTKLYFRSKAGQERKTRPRDACLVVIYGEEIGRRISLSGQMISLGRSNEASVTIDQESVSRVHCAVQPTDGGFEVRDLGSTNGTYVNGRQVERELLRDGDQIKVGQTIIKYLAGDSIETQYHEVIYHLMTMDELTGVHNRRYFEETLGREVRRSRRHRRSLCLALLDLDYFKRVNDEYGHLAGDAVLSEIGHMIQDRLRADDVAARVGGEEFALLLPEVDLEGASNLCEELRDRIANHTFSFLDVEIPLTISVGIATWDEDLTNPEDLFSRADGKLYEAKEAGRNRIAI